MDNRNVFKFSNKFVAELFASIRTVGQPSRQVVFEEMFGTSTSHPASEFESMLKHSRYDTNHPWVVERSALLTWFDETWSLLIKTLRARVQNEIKSTAADTIRGSLGTAQDNIMNMIAVILNGGKMIYKGDYLRTGIIYILRTIDRAWDKEPQETSMETSNRTSERDEALQRLAEPESPIFMHYTISQDMSGSDEVNRCAILSRLAERVPRRCLGEDVAHSVFRQANNSMS